MTTPATDGKMLVNALYHSAVVSGLAARYARLGKIVIGGGPRSLTVRPARGGRRSRHGDQRHANKTGAHSSRYPEVMASAMEW